MKASAIVPLLAFASRVVAFPSVANAIAKDQGARDDLVERDVLMTEEAIAKIEKRIADAQEALIKRHPPGQKGGFREGKPNFNAKDQYVSTSGKHKFVAPDLKAGDQRGPCPGLNAMANHGYLPHNGVGGAVDFITGTFEAFGMGPDLALILTTIGQTIDGDGLQWSIGGPSKALPAPIGGLLGTPQGISGSHNKYEADASPGRGDLYKYGNDFALQIDQFDELHKMGEDAGDFLSLEILQEFRAKRFQNSIDTNPYFFNGPFSGILVQPAAYEFIYRFMSNKSEEYPRGYLNTAVLRTFFAVNKDPKTGKLTHNPGHEKFPNNWYKRAIANPYTQITLTADTLVAAVKRPQFSTVGGNTGKVGTFTGVDPANLTNGVINSENILQGNNLACLAYEFQATATPDLIRCSKVLQKMTHAITRTQKVLGNAAAKLKCPKIKKFDTTQFEGFPGYTQLNCQTGTYDGVQ